MKKQDANDGTLSSGTHVSYWISSETSFPRESFPGRDLHTDVVIVGAGIAGLSVAYCLAKKGKQVIVVEDGYVGSGESGRTTAHLVTSLDDRYFVLEDIHGEENSRLAADSHKAAIDLVETIVKEEKIDCDFERIDGYLFLHKTDKPDSLDKELKAARRAGVKVESLDKIPGMDYQTGGCLKFSGQGQFHITKYLKGLCDAIEKNGGRIFTETRAKDIDHEGVMLESGFNIRAAHIVVATNSPINNLFAVHGKQAPYRSYVIGAKVRKGSVPRALWWDTGDHTKSKEYPPYHYVRLQPLDQTHDLLIAGGEDHPTGKGNGNTLEPYELIEKWTRKRFPIGEVIYQWSGQIMETADGLAYIGRNPMDKDNVYIVTGDSGNGMTHGTIAGILITDLIEGKENPWEKLYDPGRVKLKAVKALLKDTVNVMAEYFKDYPGNAEASKLNEIQKGEGKIIEIKGEKFGAYRDDENDLHIVSAVCTHLQCIVKWNRDEKSWDCPCHGSRFTPEGKVLNGPAISDLPHYKKQAAGTRISI